MPTYYTALTNGAAGNAAAWNTVLTQLDDQLVLMAAGSGFNNKSANLIFAGPSSGGAAAPSFRALVDADIPAALTLSGSTIENSVIGASTPAAGTFSQVNITGAATVTHSINGSAGQAREIVFKSANVARWKLVASNTAESGSNAGTYFWIQRHNDAGTYQGIALQIERATGHVTLEADLIVGGSLDHNGSLAGFYGTAPTAKPTVTGSRGGNAALASLLTALASQGLITNSSSA